jgi:hypothetical protein
MGESNMLIHCCKCNQKVEARLTCGTEIYPHRYDLRELPFWKCDTCKNFVGCHHKTNNRTQPLGCIPCKEIKNARQHIHKILDPLWQSKRHKRKDIYALLSEKLGWKYHTAKIRTIEEARAIYSLIRNEYYAKKS